MPAITDTRSPPLYLEHHNKHPTVVPDFVFDVDTENKKVKVRTFEMVEADDSDDED